MHSKGEEAKEQRKLLCSNFSCLGVSAVAQWIKNLTAAAEVAVEAWVPSLARCKGLKDQLQHKQVAATALSQSISGPGTSICHTAIKLKKKNSWYKIWIYFTIQRKNIKRVLTAWRRGENCWIRSQGGGETGERSESCIVRDTWKWAFQDWRASWLWSLDNKDGEKAFVFAQ